MWSRVARRVALWVAMLGVVAAVVWVALPHYRPGLAAGERYGIDVSAHQGRVAWRAVAADDIDFAYPKASEGGDFVDERFAENWRDAHAAGLDRGAYHFFTLCRPGADQAANFLRTVPPDPTALAPAVDLELKGNCSRRPTRPQFAAELDAFVTRVEKAWGRTMIVYTNDDFDDLYPVRDQGRPLWEATYYRRPEERTWTIWQVTALASIDGVNGGADLDIQRQVR
ncbi:GH25 family lysozyme [Spongisporangium articulatum]|uniref:GH25 family lysozyme n=1 Tax=Spongisporangium articulatum TaxID=3362603 RepID=A0ABW8ALD7_9ACTN